MAKTTLQDYGFKGFRPLMYKNLWNGAKNMTEETNILNPKILGQVELPKLDLTQYEGLKSVIASVEYENNTQYGLYAKIKSAKLEGEKEIQASKVLGLHEVKDENDKVLGYGWGKDTKTALFLAKHKAKDFEDLVGKPIIILREIKKDGKEFLTF